MTPVYQRTGSVFGQSGDCFAACLASVLDLRLGEVPNFVAGTPNGEALSAEQNAALNTWLRQRGLHYIEFGFQLPIQDVTRIIAAQSPGLVYLIVAATASGRIHAAVARSGKIIHDPACAPGATVLARAANDGYTRVGIFSAAL